MTSKSLWLETDYEALKLEEDINCDILIIGAGLSGLTTAYYLSKANKKVVVIDANRIGHGTSGHTTAHITLQHDAVYYKYLKYFGLSKTKIIAKENIKAIKEIKRIVDENGLECDLEVSKSYLLTNTEKGTKVLEKEYKAYKTLEIESRLVKDEELFIPYKLGICLEEQMHFNPMKYMVGLAKIITEKGSIIYENTRVIKIKDDYVLTEDYKITFEKVVIATHNPIKELGGFYSLKKYQDRSYTVAFNYDRDFNGMLNVIDKDGYTYRKYEDLLLVGGRDHKCGKESKKEHYNQIIKDNNELEVYTYWSAQDPITLDHLPYIGKYNRRSENMYVITGFGKWGMTNSNIAGRIICDLILKVNNEASEIYSPQRIKPCVAWMNLVKYNVEDIYNYMLGIFKLNKPSCPHLKCKMNFNKEEGTFDCPCHGSRITKDGKILETPAKKQKQDLQK